MVAKDKETHRYEREVVDGFRTLALKDPEMARSILSESQKALAEHDEKKSPARKKYLPEELAFSKGSTSEIMNLMSDVSENSAESSVPRASKSRTQSDDMSMSQASDVASSLRSLRSHMDNKTHPKKAPFNRKGKPPLPKKTGFRPFSRFRKQSKPPLSAAKRPKTGARQGSVVPAKPKNVTVDATKTKQVKEPAKVQVPEKEEKQENDAPKSSDPPAKSFAGIFDSPFSSMETMMTGFFAEDNKKNVGAEVDAEERDDTKVLPYRSRRSSANMPSLTERMGVSSESDESSAVASQPSLSYSSDDETEKSGGTFESNEDTLSDGNSEGLTGTVGHESVRSVVLPNRAIRAPPCGLSPSRAGPPSVRSGGSSRRKSSGSSVRSARSARSARSHGTSRRAGPPSVRSGVGPALSQARSFRSVRSGLGSVTSRRTLSRKPSIRKVEEDCDVSLDGIGMKETFDDNLSGVFFKVPNAAPRDSFEMEMANRGIDDDFCFCC